MARPVPARLTPGEGRRFGLTVGAAFAVLGVIILWRGHPDLAIVPGGLALLLLSAAGLIPHRLGWVFRTWMGLAHAISRATTPIFLWLVFYAVITPVGLLRRLLGKNPLVRRARDGSYWVSRDEEARGTMMNQF